MKLSSVIKVDPEKCVNCHRCIAVCPSKMCNDGSGDYVKLNDDLCLGCGSCIDACTHGARIGIDDADEFFADLKKGENIVAIVAPSSVVNFQGKELELNGWLKSIGIKSVFDVSFGAELTTKSYVEYIKKNNPKCIISQPCPALVSYIELYKPELIPYLAPADSPMAHTMKMIRHFYKQYDNCKIAVISPCYAKKHEFEEIGMGDYNVTMKSLDSYFKENKIDLSSFSKVEYENPMAERGVLYSTPGGLMRTAERFVPGISSKTRKIEGHPAVFNYFNQLSETVANGDFSVCQLIDCLNCECGCNQGAKTTKSGLPLDKVEGFVEDRKNKRQNYWTSKGFTKTAALKKLNKTIDSYWKDCFYNRTY